MRQHFLGLGERGKALQEMQKLLFDLEVEERQYTTMEPRQLTNPLEFDVVITDITNQTSQGLVKNLKSLD
jgi:hypothetical protein